MDPDDCAGAMATSAGADPQRVRSFIAIDLEPRVLAAVRALQLALTKTRADVRWVRADGMHVTLKFLGPVEPARLARAHSAIAAALGAEPCREVRARRLGAFPSVRRPRVLWVGIEGEALGALAHAVDRALAPLGFAPETRAFSPHLTLGRVNSLRGWPALEELFKAHLDDDFGASRVTAVTIFRSTLQPGGAVYTPLWTIPLQQMT
jgi:2'-5' RNA ligase